MSALDEWTEELVGRDIPWGPARKSLNLFLRDLSYNYMTRIEYGLADCERDLEVPLDGKVMAAIRREKQSAAYLQQLAVKRLTPEISATYQHEAGLIAKKKGIFRVELDLEWWSEEAA